MTETKGELEEFTSSVEQGHILNLLLKCKFRLPPDQADEQIKELLMLLDSNKGTALILKALKFSELVTISMDFEKDDLTTFKQADALGYYSYEEGELLLGAKNYRSKEFLGTLAHELAHSCMQTVFINECFPYHSCDPGQIRQREFQNIVDHISDQKERTHYIIQSVFDDYSENKWHQELIVRVPQMIAQFGSNEAREILSGDNSTKKLLKFYETYVIREIEDFIEDGPSVQSRRTVYSLNKELCLFQSYKNHQIHFTDKIELHQSEDTLWTICSPHPFLTFFQFASSLNSVEPTSKFFTHNVFCEFGKFEEFYEKIVDTVFELKECKSLFLVCPGGEDKESFENLFGILEDLIGAEKGKNVFLFVKDTVSRSTQKYLNDLQDVKFEFIKLDECSLSELDRDSKIAISEAIVTFQGSECQLNKILEESEHHLINGKTIESVIKKENVIIGKKCASLRDLPPSFVEFRENIKIDRLVRLIKFCVDDRIGFVIVGRVEHYPNRLKDTLCDVFDCDELDGISTETRPPIVLHSSDLEFDYLSTVNGFEGTDVVYFVRVKSKFSISCNLLYYPDIVFKRALRVKFRRFLVPPDDAQLIEERDFIELFENSVLKAAIITDKAGTGKTKFLNSVYHELMTTHWTIKSTLKGLASILDHRPVDSEFDEEYVLQILQSFLEQEDSFTEGLLKSRMQNRQKYPVILVLDGMDEITSTENSDAASNREKVVNFFQYIKDNTCFKILIATRPETEADLWPIGWPSYEFVPIELEKCSTYLEKLCSARNRLFTDNDDTSLIAKRLSDFGISPGFFEIPLHVNMIAEILVEQFRSQGAKSQITLTKIDKLYSTFVDIKYRIYFDEKKNINIDQSLKKFYNSFEKRCNLSFQDLALFYLFANEDFALSYLRRSDLFRFENDKVLLELEKISDYSDVGIISCSRQTVHNADRYDFCHETFAEFYASSLFMSWTIDHIYSELLIDGVLYEPDRVSLFYEFMLDDAEIPTASLSSHGEHMVKLDFDRTIRALKHHIWFDRLNIVDLILKSWKQVGRIATILDHSLYTGSEHLNYPIFFAAVFSTNRVIERLLEENFDLNYKPSERSIFSLLLEKGNFVLIRKLVDAGRIKIDLENNKRLILNAVVSGNIELVEWLEENGHDIYSTSEFSGNSAIHYAITAGKLDMVEFLQKRGMSIFYRTSSNGSTALHEAVKRGQSRAHIVQWLVDQGIEVNCKNNYGLTPLHVAAHVQSLPMVQLLHQLGADLHLQSDSGFNALHYAASQFNWDLVNWLLAHGSVAEATTPKGFNAIHIALKYSSSDTVVDSLLNHLSNVSAVDSKGRGYLHWAAQNEKKFRVDRMIARGCDANMRDKDCMTAAHFAIESMGALEPYEIQTEDDIESYSVSMLEQFKFLVEKMKEKNADIIRELLVYSSEISTRKTSFILDQAKSWLSSIS